MSRFGAGPDGVARFTMAGRSLGRGKEVRMFRYAALAGLLMLAACSKPPPAFNTQNGMHEVMEHVIDPAAWVFWNASGYITTAEGTVDRAPTTPEGWQAAENAAATVAEAGNLLLVPGRGPDETEWKAYAAAMTKAGLAGMKAAEAHDGRAVFVTGGQIYEACSGCHKRYIVGEK